MSEPAQKCVNNSISNQNYAQKLFIAFKMAYSCRCGLRGNLDFPDFLQKSFITLATGSFSLLLSLSLSLSLIAISFLVLSSSTFQHSYSLSFEHICRIYLSHNYSFSISMSSLKHAFFSVWLIVLFSLLHIHHISFCFLNYLSFFLALWALFSISAS